MRKSRILLICILSVLLFAAVAVLLPWGEEPQTTGGWQDTPQGRCYLDASGETVRGWQRIDGVLYYFDPQTGLLAKGWLRLPEGTWLLDDHGRPTVGWLSSPQGRYFFDSEGHLCTGWREFPEGTRYFAGDGVMAVGFLELDGNRYCFDPEGCLCRFWQELQGYRYYFGGDGRMVTGLTETEDGTYFLDEEGHMLTGWQDTGAGRRYFGGDGRMVTGWLVQEDGLLYLDEQGTVCTGWLQTEEGTWLLGEDGHPYTGWLTEEGRRCYFQEDGRMATGFCRIDGKVRYFAPDGNYIPLVNFENPVPEDYVRDLVTVEEHRVDSTCAQALVALMEAARADGLKCELNSTYRSRGTQKYLWDRRYQDYLSQGYSPEEAYRLSARRVAYPGTSEHELGLAIDITGTDALYRWFLDHSWEYGFTVRYQGHKEALTGIKDEPWHLRYVGRELAQLLWEQDLCLEEFFLQYQE